jgi:hypothetical protein
MFEYKETDVCHGRGFAGSDPTGYLARFYTWITTAAPAGPEWFIIDDQSAAVSDPYIVVCDIAAPVVNDIDTGQNGGPPKFVKVGMITTEAGFVRFQPYMWWDSGTHVGRGLFAGHKLATYDDADFQYFFVGGTEGFMMTARTGTVFSTSIIDEWTGDVNLVEPFANWGIEQTGVVAGANVVLQLDVGEAANFTDGNYYYIYDFDGHTWVNYVQCVNVDLINDRITVDSIAHNFPAGSVIGAYIHRWYTSTSYSGGGSVNDLNFSTSTKTKIPYSSGGVGFVVHDQAGTIYGGTVFEYAPSYIGRMAPNDDGVYAVMRPGICELYRENDGLSTGMNRAYGIANNTYLTAKGTMAVVLDGRVISGDNWLYYQAMDAIVTGGSNGIAVLYPDH